MKNFTLSSKPLYLLLSFFVITSSFSQTTASYSITFNSIWESTSVDPINGNSVMSIPGNAHWSNLVGTTHNSNYTMVEMGTLASLGIKNVAELGNNDALSAEVQAQINLGNANQWLQEPFSPFDAISSATLTNVVVSSDFPLLSLAAMIAPSPDWMIAINAVNLRENGTWRNEIIIPLFPYDAGTDSGTTYTSADVVSNPVQPITSLVNSGPFNANPIGTLTINLNQVLSVDESEFAQLSLFPNPLTHSLNIKVSDPQMQPESYRIINVIGQEVSRRSNVNESDLVINVSYLNEGIYFIELSRGNNTTVKRFLKQK
ncbi:MAG: T9SS type A sorting domain-containing protein [Psychroserpens sp.]|nr:T9SS type A sorting domain-containing protein [Psychroserpens sp.]